MGVGRPKDFVTNLNRFPPHFQWVTNHSNDRFVTTSAKNQLAQRRLRAFQCCIHPLLAISHLQARAGNQRQSETSNRAMARASGDPSNPRGQGVPIQAPSTTRIDTPTPERSPWLSVLVRPSFYTTPSRISPAEGIRRNTVLCNKFTTTNSMRYMRSLIILCVLFTSCAPWRGVVSTIQVRRDTNGNVPQDIAKKFIEYAEADNYEAAARLFEPEAVKELEKNTSYGDGFKGYCNHFKKNDEHRFSSATRGKGEYFWLSYRAKYNSRTVGSSFYFIMIDGVWKMTR